MKIIVLGNAGREGVPEEVARLLPHLQQQCQVLLVDLNPRGPLANVDGAELAVVFGGDGAILRAARQMGYRQLPVLGINVGHLGYLTEIRQALPGKRPQRGGG